MYFKIFAFLTGMFRLIHFHPVVCQNLQGQNQQSIQPFPSQQTKLNTCQKDDRFHVQISRLLFIFLYLVT